MGGRRSGVRGKSVHRRVGVGKRDSHALVVPVELGGVRSRGVLRWVRVVGAILVAGWQIIQMVRAAGSGNPGRDSSDDKLLPGK